MNEINFPKGGSNAWLGVQGAPHLVPSGPGVPSCMKIISINRLTLLKLKPTVGGGQTESGKSFRVCRVSDPYYM